MFVKSVKGLKNGSEILTPKRAPNPVDETCDMSCDRSPRASAEKFSGWRPTKKRPKK